MIVDFIVLMGKFGVIVAGLLFFFLFNAVLDNVVGNLNKTS